MTRNEAIETVTANGFEGTYDARKDALIKIHRAGCAALNMTNARRGIARVDTDGVVEAITPASEDGNEFEFTFCKCTR